MHDWSMLEMTNSLTGTKSGTKLGGCFCICKGSSQVGQVRRIPINLVSEFVRCDLCNRPKAQANYVSWNKVLYCERHLRARNRKLTKPLRWQQKVREMDRIARDHQAAFKDL